MDVLNRIIQIYEGEIPTCWNYRFEEYPINYQVKVPQSTVEAQPFSQEFVATNLDPGTLQLLKQMVSMEGILRKYESIHYGIIEHQTILVS